VPKPCGRANRFPFVSRSATHVMKFESFWLTSGGSFVLAIPRMRGSLQLAFPANAGFRIVLLSVSSKLGAVALPDFQHTPALPCPNYSDMLESVGTLAVALKICVDNIILAYLFIASVTPPIVHVCESRVTLTFSGEREINMNRSVAGLGFCFLICITDMRNNDQERCGFRLKRKFRCRGGICGHDKV